MEIVLGSDPKTSEDRLREYLTKGICFYFVLGTARVGNYKWVITKLSRSDYRIDNKGNVLAVKVNVTLNSYEKR
ncbi:MAG: phage tail protein [Eubacterium sp.]|nr:phage tail protein [Eubacterium sp.]